MKKEKSKVSLTVASSLLGLFLILNLVFSAVSTWYGDHSAKVRNQMYEKLAYLNTNYTRMHAMMILTELRVFLKVNTLVQSEVLNNPQLKDSLEKAYATADKSGDMVRSADDITKIQQTVSELRRRADRFERSQTFWSLMSNIAICIAIAMNVWCIYYGWKIYGLYKT